MVFIVFLVMVVVVVVVEVVHSSWSFVVIMVMIARSGFLLIVGVAAVVVLFMGQLLMDLRSNPHACDGHGGPSLDG